MYKEVLVKRRIQVMFSVKSVCTYMMMIVLQTVYLKIDSTLTFVFKVHDQAPSTHAAHARARAVLATPSYRPGYSQVCNVQLIRFARPVTTTIAAGHGYSIAR